eukprot:CFRG5157T1
MDIMKRNGLVAIPMTCVFLLSGVSVNIVQTALYVCVRPFSLSTYRTLNQQLVPVNWALFVCLADWWAGLKMKLYGNPEVWDTVGKHRGLTLVNHASDIDWLLGWMVAERFGMLGGTKALMKESAKYVPVLGWSWWFSEFIWLKRSWGADQQTMSSGLQSLEGYPDPYWITLFPEGTRYTEKKHVESQKFCKEKGLPLFKHLLHPRPKGFTYTVKCIRNDIDTVYDVTLAFKDGKRPTMAQLLRGEGGEVHVFCEKYDPNDLPDTDEGLLTWLNNSFKRKDDILDYHEKHGAFEGEEYPVAVTKAPLYISMFWFTTFFLGTTMYFCSAYSNGEWYKIKIAAGTTAIVAGSLIGMLRYSEGDRTKVTKGAIKKVN